MDFKKVFINMLVVGVIVLGIISWIITTQQQNNTAELITNNTLINKSYGNLYGNISSTQEQAGTASTNFGNTTPTQSYGIVDVSSVVSPTNIFKSLIIGTYNTLIELPIKILGVPPIIAGVIDAILILFIILGIWAIWRGVA